MNIVDKAFRQLYPHKKADKYTFIINYSARFKAFNATVRYQKFIRKYNFNVSSHWADVDEEIQMGLIQSLLVKIFGDDFQNSNIELYESFMNNIPKVEYKKHYDSTLKEVFDKINVLYFDNTMDYPHLKWGSHSFRTLGHYNFHTDTITISKILAAAPQHLLDFVMFHEMLHKKHGVKKSPGGKNMYHTPAFRKEERCFDNYEGVEKELQSFARKKRFSLF